MGFPKENKREKPNTPAIRGGSGQAPKRDQPKPSPKASGKGGASGGSHTK